MTHRDRALVSTALPLVGGEEVYFFYSFGYSPAWLMCFAACTAAIT